jgi:hypothetical protein
MGYEAELHSQAGRTRWPGGVPECCQPLFFDSQGFFFLKSIYHKNDAI